MGDELDWGGAFASASTSAMRFYDEIMVPRMFEPWAELLLDEVGTSSGQRVLDVACGPGTVARRAAARVGPSGAVTGCDLSPAMLELARSKPTPVDGPSIDYLECAADALEVPDRAVDVVTCQQGLQFFPDRPAALVEMHRVLRPGGRLGAAVWCSIEDCPPFAALRTALAAVLGPQIARAYESGPWGLPHGGTLAGLAEDAGFTNVAVARRELPIAFEGGTAQLLLTLQAASVAAAVGALDDAQRGRLAEAVEEACGPITVDGAIRSHTTAHVLTASS